MTIESPIAWDIIKPALAEWLSQVTGLVVIWANQNIPQPAKPYATLNVSSGPRKLHHDWVEKTLNDATNRIERKVVGVREFTVTAQAFSDNPRPGLDAMHYVSAAMSSLEAPSIKKHFRNNHMRVQSVSQAADLTNPVNGKFQSRAALDMVMRATSTFQDVDIKPIDSANVSIEFYNQGDDEPAFVIEAAADQDGE
jgi:hypothetical protein